MTQEQVIDAINNLASSVSDVADATHAVAEKQTRVESQIKVLELLALARQSGIEVPSAVIAGVTRNTLSVLQDSAVHMG